MVRVGEFERINGVVLQEGAGLEGTLTLGSQFQERHLTDVSNELTKSQGLIIDGKTANHIL